MADNPFRGTSLRELSLFYYARKYLPDAVNRYKFEGGGKKKEVDIYFPSLKIAIEYDGGYWHDRKAERDREKNRFLNENGIYVIRIREYGLPELEPFDGEVINLPHQGLNKPETYDYINLTLERLRNLSGGRFDYARVDDAVYQEDLIHIYGIVLNHKVSPSLADMCGIEYWRYDLNGSVRPEYIPKFDWAPARIECPEGRILYLPRYRRDRKSVCASSEVYCKYCLYDLLCPLLKHCMRADPSTPLHCEYISKIVDEWIEEGKSIRNLHGAYQFELWAEKVSDLYKVLFDSIKGLPLDSPRVIKVINFFGFAYDENGVRITNITENKKRFEKLGLFVLTKVEKRGDMTVIGAGIYVFGKNIPKGAYDLSVISGNGYMRIYSKNSEDDCIYQNLGKGGSKVLHGLSSKEFSRFEIEGNLEIEIKKAGVIKFDDYSKKERKKRNLTIFRHFN